MSANKRPSDVLGGEKLGQAPLQERAVFAPDTDPSELAQALKADGDGAFLTANLALTTQAVRIIRDGLELLAGYHPHDVPTLQMYESVRALHETMSESEEHEE